LKDAIHHWVGNFTEDQIAAALPDNELNEEIPEFASDQALPPTSGAPIKTVQMKDLETTSD